MSATLHRRDVVAALLAERGGLLVVAGLGSTAWDCTAAGDHPLTFPLWGAMGQAATIGLGLALAKPERRVVVITGDGEMLMGIGSLATIGVQGMQATHTGSGVDLAGVARACGFFDPRTVTRADDLVALREEIHRRPGPNFAVVKVIAEKIPIVLPPRDGALLKARFRRALLGEPADSQ